MTTWNLKFASLNAPDDIFDLIVNGKKTVETRSRNPSEGEHDYINVKPGDTLNIKSLDTGRELTKTVVLNNVYNSAEEMVAIEDCEKIYPGIGSKENLLQIYNQAKNKWGEKYKFELEHYGIVAISFK